MKRYVILAGVNGAGKTTLFSLILIASIIFLYINNKNDTIDKTSISNSIDALAYKMELSLDDTKHSLNEKVTLKFKNDTLDSIDKIILRDMTPSIHEYNKEYYGEENANKKSSINSIKCNNKALEYNFKKDKSIVEVKLEKKLKPGKIKEIDIDFTTDIPERQDRFGFVRQKGGTIYSLSFCFPYLADSNNGKWITYPYFDDGESRSSDLADYDITFNAPKQYIVGATGSNDVSNGVNRIKAKNVRDIAIVASDLFKVDSFEASGVKINNYYYENEFSDIYRKIVKLTSIDCFNQYTREIGKYPYEDLDIIQCSFGFAFGGMEYSSLIMVNGTSYFDGKLMSAAGLSEVIAHEIGHEWFYAAVGNDEYKEGWLDEGFSTYLEKDVFGFYNGDAYKFVLENDEYTITIDKAKKDLEESINHAREDYKNLNVNISPDNYSNDQNYGEIEYDMGYLFLEELKLAMGKESFSKFIKDYYNKYYMKVATTEDVVKFIKGYDSSSEVQDIINFYVK